jgi:hypothetical protein
MNKSVFESSVILIALLVSLSAASYSSPSPDFVGVELRSDVKKRITEADVATLTSQLVRIRSDYDEGVAANHKEMAAFLADYLRKRAWKSRLSSPNPIIPLSSAD